MAPVRSILFFALFYPGTALFVIAVIVASAFGTKPMRRIVHLWSEAHYSLLRNVMGIEFEWEGEIPAGPNLVAVKHESMVEAIDTLRFARTPVVVLKRELAQIPFFGWVTRRYGVIPVDRSAGAKALRRMVALGRKAVADKRPIIIFPEGTRVPHGQRPSLRPGFAGLYRVLKLPVIPVACDSGKVWPRGPIKSSGIIRFKVGETIPPGLGRDEVEARVHQAINALNE